MNTHVEKPHFIDMLNEENTFLKFFSHFSDNTDYMEALKRGIQSPVGKGY